MVWTVERRSAFERGYAKLSSDAQRRCDNAVDELANSENPRMLGSRLVGGGYKYRFGDYRLIYDVVYSLTLLELYDVGKRGRIYD